MLSVSLNVLRVILQQALYHANKETYGLLRYGVNVSGEASENKKYVHLIDWKNPQANDFYIAEEVTVKGRNTKRTRFGDLCKWYCFSGNRAETKYCFCSSWYSSESG